MASQPFKPAAIVFGLAGSLAVPVSADDNFGGRPSGILACEGVFRTPDGNLTWKTATLAFEELETILEHNQPHYLVNIQSPVLDYGSGGTCITARR
jgi:hypothetical protein